MKNLFFTILSLLLPLVVNAQISVESFVQLNDADARANFPVIDDDGTACALIKIVTTAQDFTFDAGQLPIVKTSYEHVGEVWVYVPEGTMKLKISHKDLGSLHGADVHNDGYYYFPTNRLKRATSYRMVLTHKEVVKFISENVKANLVVFKSDIEDAQVYVGNNMIGRIKDGEFKTTWPMNLEMEYRIHKDRYEDVKGRIKIDRENIVINVSLRPLFGTLIVNSSNQASIYINGNLAGQSSITVNLDPGTYSVRASEMYKKDIFKTVKIARDRIEIINLHPEVQYANVTFTSTPKNASVSVDGKNIGSTPLTKSLEFGKHFVTMSKFGFESKSKSELIASAKDYGISMSLNKSYYYKNSHVDEKLFYFGAGYHFNEKLLLDITIGGYFSHFNIEGGLSFGGSASIPYHSGGGTIVELMKYQFSLGYGLRFGYRFLLTPQIGFALCTHAFWDDYYDYYGYDDNDLFKDCYAIFAASRLDFFLLKNVSVYLLPQTSFRLNEGYVLDEDGIKTTGTPKPFNKFSFAIGALVYF